MFYVATPIPIRCGMSATDLKKKRRNDDDASSILGTILCGNGLGKSIRETVNTKRARRT